MHAPQVVGSTTAATIAGTAQRGLCSALQLSVANEQHSTEVQQHVLPLTGQEVVDLVHHITPPLDETT